MSAPNLTAEQRALYERIQAFRLDEGSPALTFAARLARENGWSRAFAEGAIAEYRRFLLLAVTAGHPVTPSDQVDQVWHLHLLYTRSYWEKLCPEVLGRPLHHGPTLGGAEEKAKFLDWYEETLESYRRTFGEAPPARYWPDAKTRFGEDLAYVRVNMRRSVVLPARAARIAAAVAAALVALSSVL
jgi:hypothetical protein